MSGARRTRRPSTRIQLSPKQANIYAWGWQKGRPLPLRGVRPAVRQDDTVFRRHRNGS